MLLSQRLQKYSGKQDNQLWQMASNGETVAASLTFEELIKIALPLSHWWHNYITKDKKSGPDQNWLMELAGAFYYDGDITSEEKTDAELLDIFQKIFIQVYGSLDAFPKDEPLALWSVNRNRPATITIERSVPATKADACRKVFDIDGSEIAWAVLDTGIDARHLAFRRIDPATKMNYPDPMGDKTDKFSNHTRIVASYDFTRFRDMLAEIHDFKLKGKSKGKLPSIRTTSDKDDLSLNKKDFADYISEIERDLKNGRLLDWTIIAPLLRIPHNSKEYTPPAHSHGTHVAGIIGAGLIDSSQPKCLIGMCPRISLYDIRVLDDKGEGNEFNILAAIQFVRWMNNQKDGIVIHGANMSFSMIHEVASYACGQTPVCDVCERLVAEGTIVVAAAGNLGQTMFQDKDGILAQGFRIVNITDPGNAENVITVGATHRDRPHTYGVSYFSSRGPTGDGRLKPDLVAPGEKIVSTAINNGIERMDGTSMAAPHVSGAAALLLSKHRELIGRPRMIKEILCKTATDLGREKYFQGSGMVDVLRAIQSV